MNMPKNIADALSRIKKIQHNNKVNNVVMSKNISRSDRELLLKTGWLIEIIKGWYLLVNPILSSPATSTAWFINFWDFLSVYLKYRFKDHYCLSAESSLEIQTGNLIIAQQVTAIVPYGGGKAKELLFNTSLLMYSDPKNIPSVNDKIVVRGLQVMPIALALCKVASIYFRNNTQDAVIALCSIRSSAELSAIIAKYNLKAAASRLVGAYSFLGNNIMAQNLIQDLNTVGIVINPQNPFQNQQTSTVLKAVRHRSPYVTRIDILWQKCREGIINNFPKPNKSYSINEIEDLYQQDAYNSLSIEGYQVSLDLIEKVQNNSWDPNLYHKDFEQRNLLAARGYFEAFQAVKKTIKAINTALLSSNKKDLKEILSVHLSEWHKQLFAPMIRAGIMQPEQLIGYRNNPVYIRNSRHVPPPKEALVDLMESLFHFISEEPETSVRAILGHYLFVFIHPYMDGNGRIARFLMNAILVTGGYPWVVVPAVERDKYMAALAIADIEYNLVPFTKLIADLIIK